MADLFKYKRRLVQFASALFSNANIKGFFSGEIYRGRLKSICVPGLNCYSCPAAIGACPLGSLQAQMGGSPIMLPLYVIGFLTLFGVIFGRFICGWLCPFGLFQELLNKIPSKKYRLNAKFQKLPYVILFFTVTIPLYYAIAKGYALPAFCKYICPSGTIFAGYPLIGANELLKQSIGGLFFFKSGVAAFVILLSVIILRPFCKLLCPLGAIYGFFNKISIINMEYSSKSCIDCDKCKAICQMDIEPKTELKSPNCIRCGRCAKVCPENSIYFTILENIPQGIKKC